MVEEWEGREGGAGERGRFFAPQGRKKKYKGIRALKEEKKHPNEYGFQKKKTLGI